jgi:hypothetical protein
MEEKSLALTPPQWFVRFTIQVRLPRHSSSLYSATGYNMETLRGRMCGLPPKQTTRVAMKGSERGRWRPADPDLL